MSPIERAFSIHDDALMLRSQRAGILAANIANADTPNYKARDLDFKSALQQASGQISNQLQMRATHENHLSGTATAVTGTIKYRNPLQPALDGNTVDMHAEQARFSQNAVEYQTSLTMVNRKISGLNLAIKGQ